jgi:hypothetical protein
VTWLESKIQQARPTKGGEWAIDSIATQVGWAAMFGDPAAQEAFPLADRKIRFPTYGLTAWRGRPRSGGEEIRAVPVTPRQINKYADSYGWFLDSSASLTTIEATAGGPFESDEEAWLDAFEQASAGDSNALSAFLWVKADSTDAGQGNPLFYDTWTTGEAVQPRLQPTFYGQMLYESALINRLVKKRSRAFAERFPAESGAKDALGPMLAEAFLVQQWFWNRLLQVPAPYSIIEAAERRRAAMPWNPPNLPPPE